MRRLVLLCAAACAGSREPAPDTTAATPPAVQPTPAPVLAGPTWRWVSRISSTETFEAPAVGTYTLQLGDSNRIFGVADCNRMAGQYTISGSGLTIGPIATTRMGCPPGGAAERFTRGLESAASYGFSNDTLIIRLKADSGSMRFVRNE